MPDQTPREQLTALMAANPPDIYSQPRVLPGDVEDAANAILAAGWRPPARVITDPAELDALTVDSAVITPRGKVHQLLENLALPPSNDYRRAWLPAGSEEPFSSALLIAAYGSVTVLHTPENGDAP